MNIKNISLKSVIAASVVITLFACDGTYREKQKLTLSDFGPIAEGEHINLKYTDSGKLISNLITPKLLDYSNFDFPFSEYPQGINLVFWDEDGKKSTITSEYAINYDKAQLVDLRGNVHIITGDSTVLKATQLYWNQSSQWVFTDQPYQIVFKDGSFNNGNSFDSNEDFTNFLSRKNVGVQIVDNTNTDE